MKKRLIIVSCALIFVLGSLFAWKIWQNSPRENDTELYKQLMTKCEQKYKEDSTKGIRYIRYPCEESDVREQFRQKYNRDYKP